MLVVYTQKMKVENDINDEAMKQQAFLGQCCATTPLP